MATSATHSLLPWKRTTGAPPPAGSGGHPTPLPTRTGQRPTLGAEFPGWWGPGLGEDARAGRTGRQSVARPSLSGGNWR